MNRLFHPAAFTAGLAAVSWVGAGFVPSNPLALAMTVLIGAFYLAGALELHRFRQATRGLARAVSGMPDPLPSLGHWLGRVPASLQNAVRLRIEGERAGLPGPALAPYLAGLLVLLGMLGTFLGLVVTLHGTGMALESATDLQAIRASLAAPVKGLGLAFGTSVAGVAASAMLGLMSALCRRERQLAVQRLDTRIATSLRVFSHAHRREESFRLLQRQAAAMPELVDRLQAMMATLERHGQALDARLDARQERFHGKAEAAYADLAASVGRSLKESLAESARLAGATIQPVVEATMAGIARETTALHERFAGTFEQRSAALLRTVERAHVELQAELASRDERRLAAWTGAVQTLVASLQREWQQAGAQALGQQERICATLERTGRDITAQAQAHAAGTIDGIARLVQAASQAPQAAAEAIAECRRQLADGMARDNALLEERGRLAQTLATLLDAVQRAGTEQRAAIDALVSSAAQRLERVGARFTEQAEGGGEKMAAVAAQITGSAVELSSLGEAFGFAVKLFGESNEKLTAQLQRIERALGKSMARSDEQLAYYVAQAREIIDLSLLSQRQIVDDLRQLSSGRREPRAVEA